MQVVRLKLKQIASAKADRQWAELRYWLPGQTQYKSRQLELVEIAELYDFAAWGLALRYIIWMKNTDRVL